MTPTIKPCRVNLSKKRLRAHGQEEILTSKKIRIAEAETKLETGQSTRDEPELVKPDQQNQVKDSRGKIKL